MEPPHGPTMTIRLKFQFPKLEALTYLPENKYKFLISGLLVVTTSKAVHEKS
jgi:hypothetical protein